MDAWVDGRMACCVLLDFLPHRERTRGRCEGLYGPETDVSAYECSGPTKTCEIDIYRMLGAMRRKEKGRDSQYSVW